VGLGSRRLLLIDHRDEGELVLRAGFCTIGLILSAGPKMPNLSLTIACGPYDRMEGIRTGAVQIEGIDATYLAIQAPPEIFARMIKTQAFDVSEMSLSSYVSLRTRGEFPFVALPVFPSRVFRHGNIFINRDAGIARPQDLQGKRVGTFGYRQTASVWIRGILSDEYGVEPGSMHWVEGGLDTPWQADSGRDANPLPGIRYEPAPEQTTLSDMLARGEIDALIGARIPPSLGRSPDVARLFPNYREVERDYFKRTGIFPIMHTLVMREELYRSKPWVGVSLYKALVSSKDLALREMRFSGAMRYMLPWLYDEIEEIDALFGGDPMPYGLEPNRKTLETFARYLVAQGFVQPPVKIDELFVPIVEER
jgi:4,5-dihydroxyphthalate decarboxylase